MESKNKKWIYSLLIFVVFFMLTNSCKKDTNNQTVKETKTAPIVITSDVTNISYTTAICGGNITSDGGSPIVSRGLIIGKDSSISKAGIRTNNGTGIGSFTFSITDLTRNSIYYVWAYATNNIGTSYGKVVTFKTSLWVGETVTDLDGNVYHTVTIGTQVWMAENLKTTKYTNGDPIPNITDGYLWLNSSTGAYCNYENDLYLANGVGSTVYGRLYNWFAVNDSRKIAPSGWHIPTDAEWTILTTYLGGENVAGAKLKESGTTHWQGLNFQTSTNETYFTALPGGSNSGSYNNLSSGYNYIFSEGHWWSSSTYSPYLAWYRSMRVGDNGVWRENAGFVYGISVRCLKN